MMSLTALLEAAAEQPFPAHTTCLHGEQFHTIRVPGSGSFRARLDDAIFGEADLTEAHKENREAGLEVIEPVQWGTHGGRWSLRNISHAGEPYPAGEAAYDTIAEALLAAIDWWQTESWCRGILVRRVDIKNALLIESANPPRPALAEPPATVTSYTSEAAE